MVRRRGVARARRCVCRARGRRVRRRARAHDRRLRRGGRRDGGGVTGLRPRALPAPTPHAGRHRRDGRREPRPGGAGGAVGHRRRHPGVGGEPAALADAVGPARRGPRRAVRAPRAPPTCVGSIGGARRRTSDHARGDGVSAVTFRGVHFGYPDGPDALLGIDLDVPAGDVVLVVGDSGSGKSTLLRATNGLVPHSSGGRFSGTVTTFGRDTRTHAPRELADVVGFVAQDPEAQFVVDRVEHDVAFALENLGLTDVVMRRRVEEALDALGIAHLRGRAPSSLSGGERQRAAIAGALAAAPQALVLDEPTSQLDPQGADDVLAAVGRLNADLGTTVLLAEHRLERAAPLAHHAVRMDGGRVTATGLPGPVLADYPGAPTVTVLGRLLGWDPPPLTVREARARAHAVGA
ncbi:MAG: ABC transporter ATP-binding protein, partial [Actinobacteria bacterium]|nr:ABC transporter ATP-binding protein [Actinomycetota bacterium]